MSHHHYHHHDHDHDHDHDHSDHDHDHGDHDHDHGDHDHDHGDHDHGTIEMPFDEKLSKLLDHWVQHNVDHAKTYNQWAEKVRQNHMESVAGLIEEAAEMNLAINKKFEQAKAMINDKG